MAAWSDLPARFRADLEALVAADTTDRRDVEVARLVASLRPPDWQADAACREHPELSWFAGPTAPAVAICADCPARADCLAHAVAHDEVGVWGGTTDADRRKLRRTA